MNILLVNWMDMANPMAGGAEVHATEIFRRFVGRGDRVTLLCSGFEGGAEEDEYHGIRVVRTGRRETYNFTVPRAARRLHRADSFDLVVEDINKVPLFTPLYLNAPVMVMVPHLFGSTVFRETNALLASYVWLMERPIPAVYRSSVFEVISESTARDLEHRGVDPARIETVHCGMDHDRYTVDPSMAKFDRPTVLYVGRIKRYKSVETVIRAMPVLRETVPGARLAVVGSGDNMDGLKRLARELEVGNAVEFTGFVTEEEKVDWMRRSHVIVNPSPKEGWGLTNIEANACGTPAVASDSDGLRDSVRDGETGLLFPFGDHGACAERLARLLKDPAVYGIFRERALAWAQTFTWERAAGRTMEIVDAFVKPAVNGRKPRHAYFPRAL